MQCRNLEPSHFVTIAGQAMLPLDDKVSRKNTGPLVHTNYSPREIFPLYVDQRRSRVGFINGVIKNHLLSWVKYGLIKSPRERRTKARLFRAGRRSLTCQ